MVQIRTRLDKKKFRAAFEKHGLDVPALMEEFSCSRATVYRWLRKLGLHSRALETYVTVDDELQALIPKLDPTRIRREIDDLIEKAFTIGEPLSLIGDTGAGKTTIVKEIAAVLELPFLRISCDSSLELSELVGGYVLENGTMKYIEGLLMKVMQVPSLILFDEINALEPPKITMLNSLLDSGSLFVKEINKVYKMHSEASFFFAANPPGKGYYVNYMSTALINRAQVIYVPPFSIKEVSQVLGKIDHKLKPDVLEPLLRFYGEVQRLSKEQEINAQISIRNLLMFADLFRVTGCIKTALEVSFLNGILMTDSPEVKETCQRLALTVFGNL